MKKTTLFSVGYLLLQFLAFTCLAQSYCTTGVGGSGCATNDNIKLVSITGTTLLVSGNYCYNQAGINITSFPDTGSATCVLTQGQNYQLNVKSNANSALGFWIDYNHNFIYETTEFVLVSQSALPNVTQSINFSIPISPYFGKTGLRIRSINPFPGLNSSDACINSGSGEIEEYTVFIAAAATCTSPIFGGNTLSLSGDSLCEASQTILSLQGNTIASGISYQWESSSDQLSWNALPGGNTYNDTLTLYVSAYYRCMLTCNGNSVYSTSRFIYVKPFYNCYCASKPSAGATTNINSHIGNVKLSNLNNGADSINYYSPGAVGTYSNYTSIAPAQLTKGVTYPLRIVHVTNASSGFYPCLISAFIDYNHNGSFDEPYEKIVAKASLGGEFRMVTPVTIPHTALSGITAMRIIVYNESYYKQGACFPYYTGETEDYFVSINPGTLCVSGVTAGTTIASDGPKICAGRNILFTLSANSVGENQTYQWQSSTDSTNWISIPNATVESFSDSIIASLWYRCKVTCGANSAYSVPYKINLLPNNQCYCSAVSSFSRYYGSAIGKFSIGSLSNGSDTLPLLGNTKANLVYSNFNNLPIHHFARGNTYTVRLTQINSSLTFYPAEARIYIDYNQDGMCDLSTESTLLGQTTSGINGYSVSATLTIPSWAAVGVTGLRAFLSEGGTTGGICGGFYFGEVEDYLIAIDFATSEKEISSFDFLKLYPNPAYEQFSVEIFQENTLLKKLKIIDISGKEIRTIDFENNSTSTTISTSELQSGFYFVEVQCSNHRKYLQKLNILK
ncbi:MAG TPA: GEVED domain-containing protein [Bacteroidia bacterium]|nr:GEVED domain-containing protein [Bacteroidia bacterium]HRH09758.1 GEVED domain-containing protein [Bacteroidia bacterium]